MRRPVDHTALAIGLAGGLGFAAWAAFAVMMLNLLPR